MFVCPHGTPALPQRPAGELKALRNPPAGVDDITAVVLCLLENVPKDKSWAAACERSIAGGGEFLKHVALRAALGSMLNV
jgi:hypothetical protein